MGRNKRDWSENFILWKQFTDLLQSPFFRFFEETSPQVVRGARWTRENRTDFRYRKVMFTHTPPGPWWKTMIIHTFVQLRDSIYETNALPYREQPIESGIFRRPALSKNTKKNASVDAKPFKGQFAWTRRTAPTLPSQISSGKTPMISGETSSTSSLARSSCRSHYCAASSAFLSLPMNRSTRVPRRCVDQAGT